MGATDDDCRRRRQEHYLQGAQLTLKRYQALTAQWEHEHCVLLAQVPRLSLLGDTPTGPRRQPGSNSAEGYTNLGAKDRPAGKWWICRQCFEAFAAEFEWSVVETDPEAWPYECPEPDPRPTAADYTPPEHVACAA